MSVAMGRSNEHLSSAEKVRFGHSNERAFLLLQLVPLDHLTTYCVYSKWWLYGASVGGLQWAVHDHDKSSDHATLSSVLSQQISQHPGHCCVSITPTLCNYDTYWATKSGPTACGLLPHTHPAEVTSPLRGPGTIALSLKCKLYFPHYTNPPL